MSDARNSNDWDEKFACLVLRHLEGTLSAEETRNLGERLESDQKLCEQFVFVAKLNQSLLEHGEVYSISELQKKLAQVIENGGVAGEAYSGSAFKHRHQSVKGWSWRAWAAIAALLLCAIGIWSTGYWKTTGPTAENKTSTAAIESDVVATVERTAGTDLAEHRPNSASNELRSGDTVSFGNGIVELKFVSGATLTLTGPVKLKVEDATTASLLFGAVSVKADKENGFVVNTPDATIKDIGTEFAAVVDQDGQTQLKVIDGLVDLTPNLNRQLTERLISGESRRIESGKKIVGINDAKLQGLPVSLDRPDKKFEATKDTFVVSGQWADQNAQLLSETKDPYQLTNGSDLLLKYDIHFDDFNRAALIGFDLSSLDRKRIVGARLRLTIAPNELANVKTSSHEYLPDRSWRFWVGGVWDKDSNDWDEKTVTWNHAPGIAPDADGGRAIGPYAPMEVGEFFITGHGNRGDMVAIEGNKLVDFLKADNDGKLTFVIHRMTGDVRKGLFDHTVHGLASRENRELEGPRLEIWLTSAELAE